MKLSTALATLLLAQRGVAGFAPPPAFVRGNGIHISSARTTARSIFVDPSWFESDDDKEEASSTIVATVSSASPETVVEEEKFVDPAVGRLMDKLGLSEKQIYGEYLKWCMEFRKTPSTDRYEVFQLNFLLQQDYGFETNEYFNLNEYGDCTEEEYLALMVEQPEETMQVDIVVDKPEEPKTVASLDALDELTAAFDATVDILDNDVTAKFDVEEKSTLDLSSPPSILDSDFVMFSNKVEGVVAGSSSSMEVVEEDEAETETNLEQKYAHISDPEEKAYQVLVDLGFASAKEEEEEATTVVAEIEQEEKVSEESSPTTILPPAEPISSSVVRPLDDNFSYLDVPKDYDSSSKIPYMDYLKSKTNLLIGNTDHKLINYANSLQSQSALAGGNTHTILSYSDQIQARVTFTKGKRFSGNTKMNASTSYLDQICNLLAPYLQHKEQMAQANKPADVESALQDRYAAIDNLGDRAFQVLLDLCMVNDSSTTSGGSACHKPTQDL